MVAAGYLLVRWEPEQLPVRVVTVDGELRRLSPKLLQETVIGHLHGGILTQDLAELKTALEALPWVHSASLRRRWPDRLALVVEENVPFSRWGADGLATADGVVFRPEGEALPQGLPQLSGADEQAALVVSRYQAWAPRFAVLGLAVDGLSLDSRGAWTLQCGTGFTLALGKFQIEERVSRFLRAYPSLAAAGRPGTVDMRYSNGLAVRWSDTGGDPAAGEEGVRTGTRAKGRDGSRNRS